MYALVIIIQLVTSDRKVPHFENSRAYQRLVKMKGEELSLPGLPYNPRQLFWLSGASIWCSSMRDEALKSIVLTDPHSPSRYQCIQGWGSFPFKQNWKHKSANFFNQNEIL